MCERVCSGTSRMSVLMVLLWCIRISSVSAVPRMQVQSPAPHSGLKDLVLPQLWWGHNYSSNLIHMPWGGRKRKKKKNVRTFVLFDPTSMQAGSQNLDQKVPVASLQWRWKRFISFIWIFLEQREQRTDSHLNRWSQDRKKVLCAVRLSGGVRLLAASWQVSLPGVDGKKGHSV